MSQGRKPNHGGQGRQRNRRRYGGPRKANLIEQSKKELLEYNQRANDRLNYEKTGIQPVGLPDDPSGAKAFSFEWTCNPVKLSDEEKMAEFVVRRGEFGWVDDDRVDEIAAFAEPLSISSDQALSLRSALLQQKTVYGHSAMRNRGRQIHRDYKQGMSVVELSKKYDFPPMNIFRQILAEKGWSKSKIKEAVRAPSRFSERERKEFEAAEEADRVSNVDQSETHLRADVFENILADWFEEQGVRLRRQPELVKEQSAEIGRPKLTPDILFLDHVEINGQPVAWIDAKHFYGADVGFQRKKMQKQMMRYIGEWGSGAIVFRHGFSENLYMAGVTMLDASPLDLSDLQDRP
ncbi:MAG: TPD domain-containing protein [Candidatus Poseidoniaceae archaeon]